MLNKLEKLEEEINNKGIRIINKKTLSIKAAAIKIKQQESIIYDLNKLDTPAKRHSALLHEYCHIETGSLYTLKTSLRNRQRCEYKARKAMVVSLISSEEFKNKIKKGYSKWEIAEELCVTENVIDEIVIIYKNMGKL